MGGFPGVKIDLFIDYHEKFTYCNKFFISINSFMVLK